MRNWKKRWNQELNSVIPPLRQDTAPATQGGAAKRSRMSTKRVYSMVGSMAAMLALCIAIGFSLWKLVPPVPTPDETSVTFVSVEINPSACFSADETGVVTEVVATNQDADVILHDEERLKSLVGVSLTDAIQRYTDYAAELGYLNLVDGDAVRLTMCEGGKESLLLDVKQGLTTYFCQQGIFAAIVEKTSNLEEFCAKQGIGATESLEDLKGAFHSLSPLFSERNAQGKTVEDLTQEYKNNILDKQLKLYLEKASQTLTQRVEGIVNLYTLNASIMDHEDNSLGLDFWTLDAMHLPHTSQALEELLRSMQEEVRQYEHTFQVRLDSAIALYAEYTALSQLSLEDLSALLADFSVDQCLENPTLLVEVFLLLGLDETMAHCLTSLPSSYADYDQMVKHTLKAESEGRKKEHGDAYNQSRPSISEEEYFGRLEDISKEFGSLDQYFDEIKGNGHRHGK